MRHLEAGLAPPDLAAAAPSVWSRSVPPHISFSPDLYPGCYSERPSLLCDVSLMIVFFFFFLSFFPFSFCKMELVIFWSKKWVHVCSSAVVGVRGAACRCVWIAFVLFCVFPGYYVLTSNHELCKRVLMYKSAYTQSVCSASVSLLNLKGNVFLVAIQSFWHVLKNLLSFKSTEVEGTLERSWNIEVKQHYVQVYLENDLWIKRRLSQNAYFLLPV